MCKAVSSSIIPSWDSQTSLTPHPPHYINPITNITKFLITLSFYLSFVTNFNKTGHQVCVFRLLKMRFCPKGFSGVLLYWVCVLSIASAAGNFNQDFDLTWGDHRSKVFGAGKLLSLSLDKVSGSGFQSKKEYLFGRIDMQLKLVSGNSAGTVTAYYLSSQGPTHDEIDFEFLGNVSGQPYIVHTNVFTQGKGNREQQFYLWFDPTRNFHTYSIVWNPQHIIFMVDNTPIREFRNHEARGVPFPKSQPMRIYSSLWNADDWATRGGLVKTDWSKAPFSAYYRNFNDASACAWSAGSSTCSRKSSSKEADGAWQTNELDANSRRRLRWVQRYFMIYNYCTDVKRFPQGPPAECK